MSVVKINQKSEWKRFLIRKGGKNTDLIGKESLWIYTPWCSGHCHCVPLCARIYIHSDYNFGYYYKHNLWWRIRKYTWYFWLSRNEKGTMRNNVYYKKSVQHFRKHINNYYCSCQYSTGKLNITRSLIHFYIEIHLGKKLYNFF